MRTIFHWLLNGITIMVAAYLLPGVTMESYLAALAVAVVLGLLNTFIKPLLILLTLPINILTLGLFTFVINALIIMLASGLVPGFTVNGFGWALLYGFVLAVVNWSVFSLIR